MNARAVERENGSALELIHGISVTAIDPLRAGHIDDAMCCGQRMRENQWFEPAAPEGRRLGVMVLQPFLGVMVLQPFLGVIVEF